MSKIIFKDANDDLTLSLLGDDIDVYKALKELLIYNDELEELVKQEMPIEYYKKQKNAIVYEAYSKLAETTSNTTAGLHTNAFNTTIASHTFENGVGLIMFNEDVTSIGQYAFYNCAGLTSVTIPSSVTNIANYAFYSCSGLESITSLRSTAPTIQSGTFREIKTNGILYVPTGSTGYDTWMGTGNYYLGNYNWTKVEQ